MNAYSLSKLDGIPVRTGSRLFQYADGKVFPYEKMWVIIKTGVDPYEIC